MDIIKALVLPYLLITLFSCNLKAQDPKTNPIPKDEVIKDTTPKSNFEYDYVPRDSATRYSKLTDEDYQIVADELGVEVAALRAVVEIEAGKTQKGFASPGIPVINFDRTMFKLLLKKAGIKWSKYSKSIAFGRVNTKKYGTYSKAQFARLEAARKINKDIANQATFWGMFQIGGFNWKKCEAKSIDEFVFQMSYSEEMQLELFARFIKSTGLLKYLKTKNWRGFARGFNGSSYASKGYHTRLARAYAKYK